MNQASDTIAIRNAYSLTGCTLQSIFHCEIFTSPKTRVVWWKLHQRTSVFVEIITQCNGRTDRRTVRGIGLVLQRV